MTHMVKKVDFLVVTPPKKESFLEAIFDGIDRWKINLLDRDALELCSFLRENGYTVAYIPLNLLFPYYTEKADKEITQMLEGYDAKYLIDATYFLNEGVMFFTLKNILKRNIRLKNKFVNIAIGNYANHSNNILQELGYYFSGSYVSFYSSLNSNSIPGITIKDPFQEFKFVPSYDLILEYVNIINYGGRGKLNLYIKTSIGCPYHCAFCSTNTHSYKAQNFISPSLLEREIQSIDENFGLSNVLFDCVVDDCFGLNEKRSLEHIDLLAEHNIKVKYVLMRSDVINRSDDLMKKLHAVAEYVLIGVETLNDSILKNINKGEGISEILTSILNVKKYGLKTHLNWIIGLPGESHENMFFNLKAMAYLIRTGLADEIEPQLLVPFPWTEIYRNQENYNIKVTDAQSYYFEESGFISCIEYSELENGEVERAYMLSRLICREAMSIRWPLWKLEELIDSDVSSIISEINKVTKLGEKHVVFDSIRGGLKL